MKKTLSYKTIIGIGAIALAVALNVFFYFSKPSVYQTAAEPITNPEFSERNLQVIRTDTLEMLIRAAYSSAIITYPTAVNMKVSLTGGNLSNFYNDNPNLLEVSSEDFSILHNGNQLTATFKIEKEKNLRFAKVPTDVVYKLAELRFN